MTCENIRASLRSNDVSQDNAKIKHVVFLNSG